MTVIAALKYKDSVFVGADNCVNAEPRLFTKDSKLVKFKDGFIIGGGGSGPVTEALWKLAEGHYDFESRRELIDFAVAYDKAFVELAGDTAEKDYELLLTTRDSIYVIDHNLMVFEIEQFWAIGSGGAYAITALDILHGEIRSKAQALEVLRESMLKPCKYLPGQCAEPLEVREVK